MDHGNSLSKNQMNLAKSISEYCYKSLFIIFTILICVCYYSGKHIISSVTRNDKLAVIGLADEVSYPDNLTCLKSSMPEATPETKYMFFRFIEGLSKSKGNSLMKPQRHNSKFRNIWCIV
jgi:hypothetical protein